MLKKSSILKADRKPPKKYEASLEKLIDYRCENQEENEKEREEEIKNKDDMD